MYIGKLYFSISDFFALLLVGILIYTIYFRIPIPLFSPTNLLVLTLLFLFGKISILPVHQTNISLVFFIAIMLTLFFPLFQAILFLVAALLLMKLLKVY